MRFCPNCGFEVREEDHFCPRCGAPLNEEAIHISKKTAIIRTYPLWSIISGISLTVFGSVLMYLLITKTGTFLSSPFEFLFIFVLVVMIVIGVAYIIFGIHQKGVPVGRIEVE